MFDMELVRPYRGVVVTGCQRSGTGIMSRIVAMDDSRLYIDEDEYGTKAPAEWSERIRNERQRFVIHSPAMARYLTDIADVDDVVVVWMLRSPTAVRRSMKRIGWDDANERVAYAAQDDPRHIYHIKLNYWRNEQQPLLRYWVEVNYLSLQDHPLWIRRSQRRDFTPRQWEVSTKVDT